MNGQAATVAYRPAESDTGLFGGNSNWRGPIWFPRQKRAGRASASGALGPRRLGGRDALALRCLLAACQRLDRPEQEAAAAVARHGRELDLGGERRAIAAANDDSCMFCVGVVSQGGHAAGEDRARIEAFGHGLACAVPRQRRVGCIDVNVRSALPLEVRNEDRLRHGVERSIAELELFAHIAQTPPGGGDEREEKDDERRGKQGSRCEKSCRAMRRHRCRRKQQG